MVMQQMLRRYRSAAKELELIDQEISSYTVCDTVKGSMGGYPYIERVIPVRGIEPAETPRHLYTKRMMLKALIRKVDSFMADVDDPLVSAAMRLHYFDKKTWRDTARELGGGYSEDSLRMAVARYIGKNGKH